MSEQLTTDDFTLAKIAGSTERGAATMIESDEIWQLVVTVPADATIGPYNACTVQIIPPTGATLQVRATMPGALSDYMVLN